MTGSGVPEPRRRHHQTGARIKAGTIHQEQNTQWEGFPKVQLQRREAVGTPVRNHSLLSSFYPLVFCHSFSLAKTAQSLRAREPRNNGPCDKQQSKRKSKEQTWEQATSWHCQICPVCSFPSSNLSVSCFRCWYLLQFTLLSILLFLLMSHNV